MSDEKPMTVGELRAVLDGLADDVQIGVMSGGVEDMAITDAWASRQIPWDHDCTDWDESHRPGRDCPTVDGFEIHIQSIDEFSGGGV